MSELKCPNCGEAIEEESIVCPKCRYVVMQEDEQSDDVPFGDEDILPEGTTIADDYRIVRMVGMGGAGTVYEARQISLQNVPVALKVLHEDLSEDQNTIALLKKEVIIARELTHDNIMKVFSLGTTDHRHFIVMEYFTGQSLQDILDKSGKCSFDKAAAILVQVCDALQYAHDRGIIHLDIKPANILVGPAGNVKLCDFGIARMAFSNVTTATQRIITGSVGYMPPEQYRGRKFVSSRSDIYSLAASYYTAVTGEVPIGILDTEGIPQCILRAMERNPDNRFESVEEFHNAFIEETGYQPSETDTSRPRVTLTREIPPPPPAEPDAQAVPAESEPDRVPTMEKEPERDEAVPESQAHRAPAVEEEPPASEPAPEPPVEEGRPVVATDRKAEPPPKVLHVPETKEPAAPPSALSQIAKNPVYMAAAAGLVIAVIVAMVFALSGKDEAPETAQAPDASQVATAPKQLVGTPRKVPDEPVKSAKPFFADVKTVKADEETAKAVQSTLATFVELLNFNRLHQSYMFLSKDLRAEVTPEKFEKFFFGSPQLWKTQNVEVGKTPDGKVLIIFEFKVMDAYLGTVKIMKAAVEMSHKDPGWRITNFTLGRRSSHSRPGGTSRS